jgi:hypothetical protein
MSSSPCVTRATTTREGEATKRAEATRGSASPTTKT